MASTKACCPELLPYESHGSAIAVDASSPQLVCDLEHSRRRNLVSGNVTRYSQHGDGDMWRPRSTTVASSSSSRRDLLEVCAEELRLQTNQDKFDVFSIPRNIFGAGLMQRVNEELQ